MGEVSDIDLYQSITECIAHTVNHDRIYNDFKAAAAHDSSPNDYDVECEGSVQKYFDGTNETGRLTSELDRCSSASSTSNKNHRIIPMGSNHKAWLLLHVMKVKLDAKPSEVSSLADYKWTVEDEKVKSLAQLIDNFTTSTVILNEKDLVQNEKDENDAFASANPGKTYSAPTRFKFTTAALWEYLRIGRVDEIFDITEVYGSITGIELFEKSLDAMMHEITQDFAGFEEQHDSDDTQTMIFKMLNETCYHKRNSGDYVIPSTVCTNLSLLYDAVLGFQNNYTVFDKNNNVPSTFQESTTESNYTNNMRVLAYALHTEPPGTKDTGFGGTFQMFNELAYLLHLLRLLKAKCDTTPTIQLRLWMLALQLRAYPLAQALSMKRMKELITSMTQFNTTYDPGTTQKGYTKLDQGEFKTILAFIQSCSQSEWTIDDISKKSTFTSTRKANHPLATRAVHVVALYRLVHSLGTPINLTSNSMAEFCKKYVEFEEMYANVPVTLVVLRERMRKGLDKMQSDLVSEVTVSIGMYKPEEFEKVLGMLGQNTSVVKQLKSFHVNALKASMSVEADTDVISTGSIIAIVLGVLLLLSIITFAVYAVKHVPTDDSSEIPA